MSKRRHKKKRRGAQVLNREHYHKLFVEAAWVELAAIAWTHFLIEGRGAVVLDMRQAEMPRSDTYSADARYFSLERNVPDDLLEYDFRPIADEIIRYNPESEIVVFMLLPNREQVGYVVTHTPAPPDAFLSQFNRPRDVISTLVASVQN